ncbi:MAG: phosphotransferase family protein [Steroidobacteraceae bacterium]
MSVEFTQKVERYFADVVRWPGARVLDARRLAGGISRETWKVTIETQDGGEGRARQRDIILRLDPADSVLPSNRDVEYAAFQAFENDPAVPVPATVCNEGDASHLGTSFMATCAMPGVADIASIMNAPFREVGSQIITNHFRVLGSIAKASPREKGLDRILAATTPDSAWSDTLAPWELMLVEHPIGAAPITAAAIRYLKRHRPSRADRISIVHGDFRLGNCLYLPDGSISAVLDWEMCHLGDPLEDLAWALNSAWRPSAAITMVGGHIAEEEAVRVWEKSSGLTAKRDALHWWQLFVCVKLVAIFTRGAFHFLRSRSSDPQNALVSWVALDTLEAQMLELMGVAP